MCGVFGFISKNGKGPSPKRLESIARATEKRGPHAFGFAWVDSKGRLKHYKQRGRITSHLALLKMAHDARLLIGHCRYATHGRPENNTNNHPHAADGGFIVHNGVIHDHESILHAHQLETVSECDSETLARLIEKLDGSVTARATAAAEICGEAPLVMLGLWTKPMRLVAIRSGNPLTIAHDTRGTYLASLASGMPHNVADVQNYRALTFSYKGGKSQKRQRRVEPTRAARSVPMKSWEDFRDNDRKDRDRPLLVSSYFFNDD